MKPLPLRSLLLVFAAASALWLVLGNPTPRDFERERLMMGTVFKLKVHDATGELSKERFFEISEAAFGEIAKLERILSEWIAESPVSAANRQAGQTPLQVPREVIELADEALKISRRTNGAFDITFKPLGKLWDVLNRKVPPAPEEVEAARRLVDYRKLLLNPAASTIYLKDAGMSFGFGAIAKGYAGKRAGLVLKANGINDFIVDAGGDLYFEGSKGTTPWISGIRDPNSPNKVMLQFEVLTNCGIATSGDYERYFEHEGRRYHHIMDPATGYPALSKLRSVTVFSKDPMLADAYATAFFVMGPERAGERVNQGTKLAFVMIRSDGTLIKSANLALFIKQAN